MASANINGVVPRLRTAEALDTLDRADDEARDHGIRASTLAGAQVPTKEQDGGGEYKQWIGLIDVNVEKTF